VSNVLLYDFGDDSIVPVYLMYIMLLEYICATCSFKCTMQ